MIAQRRGHYCGSMFYTQSVIILHRAGVRLGRTVQLSARPVPDRAASIQWFLDDVRLPKRRNLNLKTRALLVHQRGLYSADGEYFPLRFGPPGARFSGGAVAHFDEHPWWTGSLQSHRELFQMSGATQPCSPGGFGWWILPLRSLLRLHTPSLFIDAGEHERVDKVLAWGVGGGGGWGGWVRSAAVIFKTCARSRKPSKIGTIVLTILTYNCFRVHFDV